MLAQDDGRLTQVSATDVNACDEKIRELEEILSTNQRITDRLGEINERLSMINGRLSGELPCEVETSYKGGVEPSLSGIIGQFKATHTVFFRHCDSIEEWLTLIEKVI